MKEIDNMSENRRRLEATGYLFESSGAGKRHWRQPGTGRLLPEDRATELVRREEVRRLEEAGWERYDTQYEEGVNPKKNAEFIGWTDDVHLYLGKEAAYAAVAGFAQRGGIPFGIKPRTLWAVLKRTGLSLADEGRTDTLARVEGNPKRVVQIRRGAIREEVPNNGE
jgi:hypothetical protein